MRQSTHSVSLIMVSSQAFDALCLRSFYLREVLLCVNSVGILPRYIQLPQIQIFQVLQISLSICYYFKNLFKFCPGSCDHEFLSTVDASLTRSAYIILCLSVQPFLGSVGEADSPPVWFLPRLSQLAYTHKFFNKVYRNTLCICLRCILSRV